jgi:tetratricopeptide (TPR) repeat protein
MRNRPFLAAFIIILALSVLVVINLVSEAPAPPQETTPAVNTARYATADLMNQPIPLRQRESITQLLPVWRKYQYQKPTLLLLSNNPHLVERPPGVKTEIDNLLSSGNVELMADTANPIILSSSAVDVALRQRWFNSLAWALPLRDPAQEMSLDKFREQLSASISIDETESAALTLNERIFNGQLRGLPFTAAALPLLQNISGPVVVHIDLGYFQPLYKNEISTPLLQIVFETLSTLKKMHLQTLAVTFSYGHLDDHMALDVRFLGDILSYLIEDPTRLDQDIPINWQRQGEALYLENFFQKEKVRDIFIAQEQEAPQAAWVKYNLYKSAAEFKAGDAALEYLAQAVALDHLYALEYLELSNMAYDKQRPDEALRMLNLAAKTFPDDVQIKLQIAQLTAEMGENEKALQQVKELQGMEWSEIYYPDMKKYLEEFADFLQGETE